MSKQNYDSKFCGSLPISFVNQVQDYGFLLVCDTNLIVLQVSDNAETFTGILYQTFPDKNISELFTAASFEMLKGKLLDKNQQRFTFISNFSGIVQSFLVLVHVKEEYILLEFEPANDEHAKGFSEIYQSFMKLPERFSNARNLMKRWILLLKS